MQKPTGLDEQKELDSLERILVLGLQRLRTWHKVTLAKVRRPAPE